MANNDQKITIKTDETNPQPVEIIADAIIKVSEAMVQINRSQLRRRAILLLIKDQFPSTYKIGLKDIDLVLDYAEKLKDVYIRPKNIGPRK
jgi:hypothetical protein